VKYYANPDYLVQCYTASCLFPAKYITESEITRKSRWGGFDSI